MYFLCLKNVLLSCSCNCELVEVFIIGEQFAPFRFREPGCCFRFSISQNPHLTGNKKKRSIFFIRLALFELERRFLLALFLLANIQLMIYLHLSLLIRTVKVMRRLFRIYTDSSKCFEVSGDFLKAISK